jgi:uncharacterized protein (TIGR03083 family)
MTVAPPFSYTAAITEHSAGLAAAAEGNLGAVVEHCPGWTVADLVWHVALVHHFWGTIVAEQLSDPPGDDTEPPRVPDDQLIARFRSGADWMVSVLESADPGAHVWTWAPARQDVAFVIRHQVQEAAVHHFDAVRAAAGSLTIAAPVAADAIDEFLTFSVSSEDDPAEPARPALEGHFALQPSDAAVSWTIADGNTRGTVRFEEGVQENVPTISGTASQLLLWLYRRLDLDTSAVDPELIERFRTLSFTD